MVLYIRLIFYRKSDSMNLVTHKAIQFAATAHSSQVRKLSDVPYIAHPFEVALTLTENGCEDNAIIAGILHDTVEDTSATITDIQEQFGAEVANIVAGCTEDKTKSWEERKKATIEHLRKEADIEEVQVVCADKLSNLRGLYVQLQKQGDTAWDCFNSTKEQQKWYYGEIIDKIQLLGDYPMYTELTELYKAIFAE